jgi:hypothetical protein
MKERQYRTDQEIATLENKVKQIKPAKHTPTHVTDAEIKLQGQRLARYRDHINDIIYSPQFERKLYTSMWKMTDVMAANDRWKYLGGDSVQSNGRFTQ